MTNLFRSSGILVKIRAGDGYMRLLFKDGKAGLIFTLSLAGLTVLPTHSAPEKAGTNQKNKASVTSRGERLFKEQHCINCHSTGSSGGCLGPILAGERARRSRLFVESRISNDPAQIAKFTESYGHAELVPHPRVSPAHARALAEFINTLSAPHNGFDVTGHAPSKSALPSKAAADTDVEKGKKLVYDRGCLMCHSFGGIGGNFAPPFDNIGTRRSPEFISQRINGAELLAGSNDSEYGGRGNVMPPSQLSSADIGNIVSYLSSLK